MATFSFSFYLYYFLLLAFVRLMTDFSVFLKLYFTFEKLEVYFRHLSVSICRHLMATFLFDLSATSYRFDFLPEFSTSTIFKESLYLMVLFCFDCLYALLASFDCLLVSGDKSVSNFKCMETVCE